MTFFYPYLGSKRLDFKSFKEYLPNFGLKNNIINTIVEPFCGSAYVSNTLFQTYKTHKYHINDNDKRLIEFLNDVHNDKFNEYADYYNNKIKTFNKSDWYKFKTRKDLNKYEYYFTKRAVRLYHMDETRKLVDIAKYQDTINFVKNATISNEDYKTILDKYKNEEDTFIFLDPPYFDSHNSEYINNKNHTEDGIIKDNTEMYIEFIDYLKNAKCKVMLIINENAITRWLYNDFIVGTYKKTYQRNKTKTNHLIVCNY